jgi:uncharacterized phage protein gp47/JayE
MAFARPTLTEIRARIQADLNERANGGTPYLRRAFEYVLSWAIAAVVHDLHGHIAYGVTQLLPTSCDATQLAQWGQMLSIPRKQPTAATSTGYTFSGTNTTVIPEGTVIQVAGNVRYLTTAEGVVSAGVATVPVEAESVGVEGNTDAATPGTLVSGITGIQTDGVFATEASGGNDLEDLEVWRERILVRIRTTPRGGTSDDYEVWVRDTPNVSVRDVYVRPLRSGFGTVDVAFTVVPVSPSTDIIPSAPQIALVQAYVDSKRPIDMAGCTVYAPATDTVLYTIAIRPNTLAVRTAVEAQLDDYHNRELGMDDVLLISRADEAVSAAAGEIDHLISVPAGNVIPPTDVILLRGEVTFSTLPEP